MKTTRALLMIAFSVVAGVVAVFFAASWLAQKNSMMTQKVVVAARDLELGNALDPSMMQTLDWPTGGVPAGATNDPKSLEARVIRTTVMRGEPILEGKLAPIGTKGGLSAVIDSGKRALTVKVNEVIGVAGFALPGNYVDILVNVQDEREKSVSKIVLERILVLAVAQEAARDETKPKVVSAVTLQVTPEEAEKLDLARSIGSLSLVLRNQVDKDPAATAGMRKEDLLKTATIAPEPSKAAPAAPKKPVASRPRQAAKAPAPSSDKVEVIRGLQRSTAEF